MVVLPVNMRVFPMFFLLNFGYLTEGKYEWQFLLGMGYISVDIPMMVYAWKCPRSGFGKKGEIA